MRHLSLSLLLVGVISTGCNRAPKYSQAELENLQNKQQSVVDEGEKQNMKASEANRTESDPEQAERNRRNKGN